MRYIPYSVVNLYSHDPLKGNPIAVVPQTQDLHETEMQSIASEFNLSLTVFISPAKDGKSLARLRFFSPRRERMFSGKGTIAAWKAYFDGGFVDLPVVLADGLVTRSDEKLLSFSSQSWEHQTLIAIERTDDVVSKVTMTAPESQAGAKIDDLGSVAKAIGLEEQALAATIAPQVFTAGGSKLFVAVTSDELLAQSRATQHSIQRNLQLPEIEGVYVISTAGLESGAISARGFYPATGVSEDAASGSAVAGLVAWLRENHQLASSGELTVRQGDDLLGGSISTNWDEKNVEVGGPVVISRRGRFVLA